MPATAEELTFILRMKDEASKTLKATGVNINEVGKQARAANENLKSAGVSIVGLGRSAVAAAGGFLGAAGLIGVLKSAVAEAEEFRQSNIRLQSILAATGYQSGLTKNEINGLVDSLERSTLFDDANLREAAANLASFEGIAGDTFKRTLEAATDLAAFMRTDVTSATFALGKALQDPVEGLTALRRAGIVFTASQRDAIKAMQDAGREAEAQGFILDTLGQRIGGLAENQVTSLTGAANTLGDAWDDLMRSIGDSVIIDATIAGLNALKAAVDAFNAGNTITLDEQIADAREEFKKASDAQASSLGFIERALDARGRAEKRLNDLLQERQELINREGGAQRYAREQARIAAEIRKAEAEAAKARAEAEAAAKKAANEVEGALKRFRDLQGEVGNLRDQLTTLNETGDPASLRGIAAQGEADKLLGGLDPAKIGTTREALAALFADQAKYTDQIKTQTDAIEALDKASQQFDAARHKRIADLQIDAELSRELIGLTGMEADAREQATAVLEAEAEARKQGATLTRAEAAAIRDSVLAQQELAASGKSTSAVLQESLEQLREAARDNGALIKGGFESVIGGLTSAVDRFAETGKVKIKDMVRSMLADFAKLASNKAFNAVLSTALDFAIGGGLPNLGGAAPGIPPVKPTFPSASGRVIKAHHPRIVGMAHGGFAQAGESMRDEAVLPLRRMPSGDLGVMAQGGGSGDINTEININISGQRTPDEAQEIARAVKQGVESTVVRILQREQKPGGILATKPLGTM